jgi:hypothetical protein
MEPDPDPKPLELQIRIRQKFRILAIWIRIYNTDCGQGDSIIPFQPIHYDVDRILG